MPHHNRIECIDHDLPPLKEMYRKKQVLLVHHRLGKLARSNTALTLIMSVKLKCVLGLCVAALLAIKVTLVSIYWQRNSGPHHGFDGRVSDWGNGAADSARRVSECRSMFEMNSDEKRISRDTNHYEDLGVALPFHPRHRGASQSPSGTPGPRALGAEDPDPRASSTGGRLPYLPCQLQEYGPELTLDCMRARLGRGRKLWILFAGDSKIRNTFLSFLNLTRVMEYNVSFLVILSFHSPSQCFCSD